MNSPDNLKLVYNVAGSINNFTVSPAASIDGETVFGVKLTGVTLDSAFGGVSSYNFDGLEIVEVKGKVNTSATKALEAKIDALTSELETANSELEVRDERLREHSEQVEAINSALEAAKDEVEAFKGEVASRDAKITEQETQIEELNKLLESATATPDPTKVATDADGAPADDEGK